MANILIVDNYLSIGLLYREVLQDEGHKVLVAKSGKTAYLLALCERVDIAVVDDALLDYRAEELFGKLKRCQPNIRGILIISSTFGPEGNALLWDEVVFKSGNYKILKEKIERVSQDCEPEIPSPRKEIRDAFKTASITQGG